MIQQAKDLVWYESIVLWKRVAEYYEKHPNANSVEISDACNCTVDLALKYKNEYVKHHRERVLESKKYNS